MGSRGNSNTVSTNIRQNVKSKLSEFMYNDPTIKVWNRIIDEDITQFTQYLSNGYMDFEIGAMDGVSNSYKSFFNSRKVTKEEMITELSKLYPNSNFSVYKDIRKGNKYNRSFLSKSSETKFMLRISNKENK